MSDKLFERLFEAIVACDLRQVLPKDMYQVPPINLTAYGACVKQPAAEFGATVLHGLTVRAMRTELYGIAKQAGLPDMQGTVVPVIDKFHMELRGKFGGRLRPLMSQSNTATLLTSLLENVHKTMDKHQATAFAIGGILLFIKKLNLPFTWKLNKSPKDFGNPALNLFYAFSMQVVSLLARVFVCALYLRLQKVDPNQVQTNPKYKKILYFIKSAAMAIKMKLPKFDLQRLQVPQAPAKA